MLRGVLGNAATVTAFRLAADVALLGFVVVLSRRFGAEGMGAYAYAVAVTAIIFSIPQYALSSLIVAQGSASREALATLWRPVQRLSALAALAGMLISGLIALVGPADMARVLLIVALAQLLYNAGEIHRAAFAAHERSGHIGWAELVYKGSIVVLGVPAMLAGWAIETALLVLPLAGAVYLAAVTRASRAWRPHGQQAGATALPLRTMITRAAPFMLSIAVAAPIYRLQPVVLAAVTGVAASGLYSAAFKPIETGLLLFGALATALMPLLVRLGAAGDRRAHDAAMRRAGMAALVIAIVGAATGIALAPWIVPLVFGEEFEGSVPAFRILCLVLPATALRNLYLAALTASRRLRLWTVAQAVALVSAAAAALLLVPPFGLIGAAIGMVVGEAVACVAAGWLWSSSRSRVFNPAVAAAGTTQPSVASPPRG